MPLPLTKPVLASTVVRIRPSPWRTRRACRLYDRLAAAEAALHARAAAEGLVVSMYIATPSGWLTHSPPHAVLAAHELDSLVAAHLTGHPLGFDLRIEERRRVSVRSHLRRVRLLSPGAAALLGVLYPPPTELLDAVEELDPDLATLLAAILSPDHLHRLPGVEPGDSLHPPYPRDALAAPAGAHRVLAGVTRAAAAWSLLDPGVREVAAGLAGSWEGDVLDCLAAARLVCAES